MTQVYHARKIHLIAKAMGDRSIFKVDEFEVIFELKEAPYYIVINDMEDVLKFVVNLDECLLPKNITDKENRSLKEQYEFFDDVLSKVMKQLNFTALANPILTKVSEGMFTVGLSNVVDRLIAAEIKEMIFGDSMVSFDFVSNPKKIEVYRNNDHILTVTLDANNIPVSIEDYRIEQWPGSQVLIDSLMLSVVCRVESTRSHLDFNIFPQPTGGTYEKDLAPSKD